MIHRRTKPLKIERAPFSVEEGELDLVPLEGWELKFKNVELVQSFCK
jgi:hypothetical protein